MNVGKREDKEEGEEEEEGGCGKVVVVGVDCVIGW